MSSVRIYKLPMMTYIGPYLSGEELMKDNPLSIRGRHLGLQFRVCALLIILLPLVAFLYLLARHGLVDKLSSADAILLLLVGVIVLGALALLQSVFNALQALASSIQQGRVDSAAALGEVEVAEELRDIARGFQQLLDAYRRTEQSLERKTRELQELSSLPDELSKTLDMDALFSMVLTRLVQATHAAEGLVYRLEDEGQRLKVVAVQGHKLASMRGRLIEIERSYVQWVAEKRQPMVVEKIKDDQRVPAGCEPERLSGSFLALPVIVRGRLLAIIQLADSDSDRVFSDADLQAARVLLRHAHMALENAWTYRSLEKAVVELEERNRQLESEVRRRKKVEEYLEHLAHKDRLTGLANRYMFMDKLEMMLRQARRHETKVAVMFVDLDRFKNINDTLGHGAGDAILQEIAGRLQRSLRDADLVARYGGDEFTLALPDIHDAESVGVIANKLVALLAEPIRLEDREYHLGGSIGISIFPDDATTVEDLIKHADAAMYVVKHRRGQGFHFYTQSLGIKVEHRLEMENDLRQALKNEEFVLFYQPFLDLERGNLTGFEALVRWNHPRHGLVLPHQFIGIAESTGQIQALGEWVLKAACSQFHEWISMFPGVFSKDAVIAVNVSALQFRSEDFVGQIDHALAVSGLPVQRLELEITESIVMDQADTSIDKLHRLKQLGIRIAIDDFGTGFSSLGYLKQFPIDTIKMDRSFVCGAPENKPDELIVGAIADLAHNLGVNVIAEGIETRAQLVCVQRHRCEWGQGYLFSQPLPAERIQQMISEGHELQEWKQLIEGSG
ncbi:MAG: EAL domain-containing protein [Zetaproteobacteria bacterium]|nr:MAG: EAL domain-containing protein [Zetaproteobacteria bacterium]